MHIAITGNMGSGKSSVAAILRALGHTVLDADEIAKQLLETEPVKEKLVKRYGSRVLRFDQTVDKAFVASRIFNDEGERRELEALVHPLVYDQLLAHSPTNGLIFSEVPLLFESQQAERFDQVWLVVCPERLARERIKATRNISDEQIDQRLKHQLSQTEKLVKADVVLDNSGDFEQLKTLVKKTLERVKSDYET
jgi:dephospho-CoA kinase